MQLLRKALAIRRRAQVRQRHRHELVARIAVVPDRGLVDRNETQAFAIGNPHRHRITFKEQTEGVLSGLRFGHVFVCGDPPAVRHRPVNNGNVTPVTQPIYDLIWLVYRYFIDPILDIVFMIFRRGSTFNSMLQDRAKRRTGFRLLVIQSVQLGISLVTDDQTLRYVEHAKPLRHVFKSCIELPLLLLDHFLCNDLLRDVFMRSDPSAPRASEHSRLCTNGHRQSR